MEGGGGHGYFVRGWGRVSEGDWSGSRECGSGSSVMRRSSILLSSGRMLEEKYFGPTWED